MIFCSGSAICSCLVCVSLLFTTSLFAYLHFSKADPFRQLLIKPNKLAATKLQVVSFMCAA